METISPYTALDTLQGMYVLDDWGGFAIVSQHGDIAVVIALDGGHKLEGVTIWSNAATEQLADAVRVIRDREQVDGVIRP